MNKLKKFYRGKSVLVTGGAGFIGSHVAEVLCANEARVTVMDDLSTGSLFNISTFSEKITLLVSDITNPKDCIRATVNKDIVFHMAAFVSVPESVKNPNICKKINVEGTSNMLEACLQNKVKTFILSSTSAVYGDKSGCCREKDDPSPISPYAESKLDAEKLCKTFFEEKGLNTASLRYFNVYGSRQPYFGPHAGVVAKFKQNLLKNEPIIVYGTGKQERDFVHVSKVVEANLYLAMSSSLRGECFNIASGRSISLIDLIKKLEAETNSKSPNILFEGSRECEIMFSRADCSKYSSFKEKMLSEKN